MNLSHPPVPRNWEHGTPHTWQVNTGRHEASLTHSSPFEQPRGGRALDTTAHFCSFRR